jgi:hypothetical protein
MLAVLDDQMTEFFRDIGGSAEPPKGPPSESEIRIVMAACSRHGIELLHVPNAMPHTP